MNRNRISLVASVVAMAGLTVACGGRQEAEVRDEGVPEEAVQRFLNAVDEFDPETLRTVFTPQAKLMPPNVASLTGPDDIVEYIRGTIADELDYEMYLDAQGLSGGLAAAEGTYKIRNRVTDEYIEEGKWLVVWVKQDDEWKIARYMTNTDHRVAAPVVEMEEMGEAG